MGQAKPLDRNDPQLFPHPPTGEASVPEALAAETELTKECLSPPTRLEKCAGEIMRYTGFGIEAAQLVVVAIVSLLLAGTYMFVTK